VLAWFASQNANLMQTSAITQAEILAGIALLPAGKRRDAMAQAAGQIFDEDFSGRCIDFAGQAVDHYALVIAQRQLAGRPIDTADGTRVADVAWMVKERFRPHRRSISLPIAPEICVEVLSPSNSREEMLGKMQLYYAAGAREVWLCEEHGHMEFFIKEQLAPVPRSVMCPDFPLCIDEDEGD
jgi:hypothetical protein